MKDQKKPKELDDQTNNANFVVDESLDKYSGPEYLPPKFIKAQKK